MPRRIVLGTAGHIDHGKTSLIKALTGIDTDRLIEEKKRGITIELGFAYLTLSDDLKIGIVDVPGHERFIRNMVAGASGVDLVALVIAADEGIMPQTREHVEICRLLGIETGIIVLTKIDMVEDEWLEMVTEEVSEYLHDTFLKDAPVVKVSAHTGEGIEKLKKILTEVSLTIEEKKESGPFRLPVDRVFSMKGFGTVVTGTSLSGTISTGDSVTVYPAETTTKVRGLQVHGVDAQKASSGLRTAMNLQGLEKVHLNRGDVVASADSLYPTKRLDAVLNLLKSAPRELKNRAEVHFHIGTSEYLARIILMSHEKISPGDKDYIQIITEKPVTCLPGDYFVIRGGSPPVTIGGGQILSIAPVRRKRFDSSALSAAEIYEKGSDTDKISLLIKESRMLGLRRDIVLAKTGYPHKYLDNILKDLLSKRELVRFDQEAYKLAHVSEVEKISGNIINFLSKYHENNPLKPGLVKEEIKTRLRLHCDTRLLIYTLNQLIKEQKIKSEEDIIALPDHKVTLAANLTEIREIIISEYKKFKLSPPNYNDLAEKLGRKDCDNVLNLLIKEGKIIKLKENLFYDPDVLFQLKKKVVDFFENHDEMTTQEFKSLTGVARKYLIPLAEYLDQQGITIRVGEIRKLRKKLG